MKIEVNPSSLTGTIPAVASKSDAHRILISAALADHDTTIKTNTWSADMQATADVITTLGAKIISSEENKRQIFPLKKARNGALLDCNESGSTLRFMLPVAAALGVTCTFTGQGKLPERPLEPLLSQLKAHGMTTDHDTLPMTISGQLHGGIFRLPGDISSQYISGLLFALPLLEENSILEITTETQSTDYIKMTLNTLKAFGITVYKKDNTYVIEGGQSYVSPFHYEVEGDWSNAAFWLCGGAMSDSVTVKGLDFLSCQGDKNLIHLLVQMGAIVVPSEKSYAVIGSGLRGITIDAGGIPDLVPILAVTATRAKGTTKIINAERLRMKESDRLKAMAENLTVLGADVQETKDGLIIKGNGSLRGGTVQSFNDHRIAMAMTIASLNCQGNIILEGAEAIAKSYPDFYTDFIKLGGKLDVL